MQDHGPRAGERTTKPLLPSLGVFGFGALEPVLVAALASETPLLLVGAHGTGKSFLLLRLAEAVFLDEISRARPEVQNKLFSIIHERRVLGMPLASLRHRWSAMNPPAGEGDDLSPYSGTERLDLALADRFAFVCTVPSWGDFSPAEQEGILLKAREEVSPEGAEALKRGVAETRIRIPELRVRFGAELAAYVRAVANLLRSVEFSPSPRRAVFLLENVIAVHAAEVSGDPAARLEGSALLALLHSLPSAATSAPIPAVRLLPLHRRAWGSRNLPAAPKGPSPKRRVPATPLETVVQLAREGEAAGLQFSAAVAAALSLLQPGGRHALAVTLFEAGLSERLDGAVAEEWAATRKELWTADLTVATSATGRAA